jgi:hypothetical protein
VTKERKEGNLEFAGYHGCSGYDGCGIVVIYSVSELVSGELVSKERGREPAEERLRWIQRLQS